MGFRIVGVSPDSERSHRNFCAKHELNFTLLADTDHSVCEAYGVWAEKSMYGRKYMGVHGRSHDAFDRQFLRPETRRRPTR